MFFLFSLDWFNHLPGPFVLPKMSPMAAGVSSRRLARRTNPKAPQLPAEADWPHHQRALLAGWDLSGPGGNSASLCATKASSTEVWEETGGEGRLDVSFGRLRDHLYPAVPAVGR